MLSDQERRDVFKAARGATAPHKVLIAGTGLESAVETLRLTEYAATLGYDAALVRTPHYYKVQMKPLNMATFFRTVADHSPLPVIIYNFPGATGYDIPAEVVIELAEHANIIGIKESSGNLEKVRQMVEGTRHVKRSVTVTEVFAAVTGRMLAMESAPSNGDVVPVGALGGSAGTAVQAPPRFKTRSKEVGFQVTVGAAHQLEPSLQFGAVGAILAFACPAPTACFEIYAAFKEGDHALAFHLIRPSHHRRFRHPRVTHQRAFDFRCAEPMPSYIQDVIDAANDPEISILIAPGAVAGEIITWKLAPILFFVALLVAVNSAQHRRPRATNN